MKSNVASFLNNLDEPENYVFKHVKRWLVFHLHGYYEDVKMQCGYKVLPFRNSTKYDFGLRLCLEAKQRGTMCRVPSSVTSISMVEY